NWIGPVWSLLGVGMAVATELNPIELAVCAAGVAEITPAAVTDFPCRGAAAVGGGDSAADGDPRGGLWCRPR
ncbi:hypothetical protein, partial [Nocardia farcinica]|uniref:hypothetical protein n=1 Tax=Nocardia farcinica TaxID=37329 RepID=UPI0024580F0A